MSEGVFEVLEIRATGSYGIVVAARRRRDPLRKKLALKVLRGSLTRRPGVLTRARDEARLLSRIDHPFIVRVEDILAMDSRPVLVMEWIDGVSLAEWLAARRGPLPIDVALESIRCAAHALADASDGYATNQQSLGVIHRDIKPSNLMISIHGVLKVVDFGLARGEFHERETTTISTVFGSHGYMAPECFLGAEIESAADVYALGVTLVECLTGRLPALPRTEKRHRPVLDEHLGYLDSGDMRDTDVVALQELCRDLCAWDPAQRPDMRTLSKRIYRLQEQAGLVRDLDSLQREEILELRERVQGGEPRQHPAWEEVAFLEAPESGEFLSNKVGRRKSPVLVESANRRVARLLAEAGWHKNPRALRRVLAFNPAWTPDPILQFLVQGEPKAWEFWKKSHSNDVLVQCLDALKHRMTPEVIALAQTYSGHPSADVARSAKVILQRSGAN